MECFICASRIGRGNAVCNIEERMDKLISVSQRVEHSSTIISDILSRILNETVMKQETICRICFNLLNDIDYHLKEAQEKTDEITNKFLDRGKDPLSYKPQPIVCASVAPPSSPEEESGKKKRGRKRRNRTEERQKQAYDTDTLLTEDEMSVNVINKSKAKLFSHILNPKAKENERRKKSSPKLRKTPEPSSNSGKKQPKSVEFIATSEDEEEEPRNRRKKSKSKKEELVTVNMDELGDLFAGSAQNNDQSSAVFYAVKSEPRNKSDEFVCSICGNKYKRALNLQLHMEKVHKAVGPLPDPLAIPETHKCDLCSREFTNLDSLKSHKIDHDKQVLKTANIENKKKVQPSPAKPKDSNKEQKEPKAKCDMCNQTFQRLFNLKTHINRVSICTASIHLQYLSQRKGKVLRKCDFSF